MKDKKEPLKVNIKPAKENPFISANYEVSINDWVLGRGVTRISIDMPAGQKPKIVIEAVADEIEISDLLANLEIEPLGYFADNQAEKETT